MTTWRGAPPSTIDNDLIGETVLFKWDAPGWCTGRVASAVAAASDLRRGLNFHAKYEDSRHPHRQGLQAGTYGKEKQLLFGGLSQGRLDSKKNAAAQ
jgi:hypothetical protein